MNLIERFKKPTPKKSKTIGRIATLLAGAIGTILTLGVVTAPIGIAILTATGAVASSVAIYTGQKVEAQE